MLTNKLCRQGFTLDPLPSPSHRVADSCPLLLCWQERAAVLLCVLHPPGRSTDGIFPGGSSYQSFSCASCHLKVSADSGVGLSMSWICRQTWGIITVQLQTASSVRVHPHGAAEAGVTPKWLYSVCSPCQDTGFTAHLARQTWEKMTCCFARQLWGEGKVGGCCYSNIYLAVTQCMS